MITAEQAQERLNYLGGSDAAAVLGLSPWVSPYALWAEKTGRIESAVRDSLRLRCGTFLEPFVVQEYERKTGQPVVLVRETLPHPEHGFIRANVDGFTWSGHEDRAVDMPTIWEAKTVGERAFRNWNGIPLYYQCQLAHYMAVTGATEAILCALVGFTQLRIYEFPRPDKFIERKLIPGLVEFWERVQSGDPPAPDAHESTGRAIREQLQSEAPVEEIVTGDEMAASIWDAYTVAKEEEAAAKKKATEAKNVLTASMVGGRRMSLPGNRMLELRPHGKGYRLKETTPNG